MVSVLLIIPARGGSKGIPRKNLRPLNGKPLIHYPIKLALSSVYKPDVVVSTDDEEIGYFAGQLGAKVHYREKSLGEDAVTLDPVVFEAYRAISAKNKKNYEYVITLQPTSPLLSVLSLDEALTAMIQDQSCETMLSVVEDTHLTWGRQGDKFVPLYKERVNRQQLPKVYRETGGFMISKAEVVQRNTRIGNRVSLHAVPQDEGIDIDTYADWSMCEYMLSRKTILFCVSGYPEIGLGHIYNCLILANEILDHKIVFLTDSKSRLGFEKIKESNYEVHMQTSENLVDDIIRIAPEVVINDRLDTTEDYIKTLKEHKFKVVNFEDLGKGALRADMVFNAIYPEAEALPNHYIGSSYFCARDEFYLLDPKPFGDGVKSVLLTFGGVDPNNLTEKTLDAIYSFCKGRGIIIKVVLGLGYQKAETLQRFEGIEISRNSKHISQSMHEADIAFSSAGRTIYELALSNTPAIIMAQNNRELTHVFAERKNGFINLGLGEELKPDVILANFANLVDDHTVRKELFENMRAIDLRSGKTRVVKLLKEIIAR